MARPSRRRVPTASLTLPLPPVPRPADEDVCLSAQACVVRLPQLRLPELGASPAALADFLAGVCDTIGERQLPGRWCHILPR